MALLKFNLSSNYFRSTNPPPLLPALNHSRTDEGAVGAKTRKLLKNTQNIGFLATETKLDVNDL